MHPDTAPIRPGEELPLDALSNYLHVNLFPSSDAARIGQFPGGHSNLTYLLQWGGQEYVLRRAPVGPVPPKAHDMVREAKLLQRVHPHFPLAPRVDLICEDPAVIGLPFYLMERRHGVIVRTELPVLFHSVPDFAPRVSQAVVDCLAQLHNVDVEAHGLAGLGKPEGFLERQARGWSERWRRAQTEFNPDIDAAMQWLAARIPPAGPSALVHNDFKLDNLMLDTDDPSRITAVLDWEMTTVGDPMADVGLTLCYWIHARQSSQDHAVTGMPDLPGWYTRDEFLHRYAMQTGNPLRHIGWHEVLGIFKLAVILQQIYVRYVRGQTKDERFRRFDVRVRALGRAARLCMEESR
jgi:aminoglycoside phosphotransferase (APT) family kinase protein